MGERFVTREVISALVTEWVISRAVMWRFERGMSQRSVGEGVVSFSGGYLLEIGDERDKKSDEGLGAENGLVIDVR
jgi:hypothetical protein